MADRIEAHRTGPEHYLEAERLLAAARADLTAGALEGNRYEHDRQVAEAQVHATLALASAIIDAHRGPDTQ